MQLVAAPASSLPGRTGYVIGRKVSVRAVDRNRIRRKLRELIRAMRPALSEFDLIVRVKRAAVLSALGSEQAKNWSRYLTRLAEHGMSRERDVVKLSALPKKYTPPKL